MQGSFKHTFFAAAIAAGLLFCGFQAYAQRAAYTMDPAHSEVDFAIRHMGISTVHGRFAVKDGVIDFDPKNVADSSVMATIDVTTVDTGVAQRDTHLKSPDFFDVAKYPTATFKSTRIVPAGDGYDVIGELTLHGVTKPVTLQVDAPGGPVNGMGNKQHMGFSATATVNRLDFGIGAKYPNAALSDEVKLTIDVDAVKQ